MGEQRYFTEATKTNMIFASAHNNSWQVFDRELKSPNGVPRPIAMCINKATAVKMCSAMNQVDSAHA